MAATLGPDDEVHYVVAPRLHPWSSGRYELRTCHLGERTCFTVVAVRRTPTPCPCSRADRQPLA